jgi:hypothetical protein
MNTNARGGTSNPWYREPWPWIIIGLLGSVVIASLITAWIAVANPAIMAVDDAEYQEIRSGLRAQDPLRSAVEDDEEAPVEAADTPLGDG